jgi:hypothetical protein
MSATRPSSDSHAAMMAHFIGAAGVITAPVQGHRPLSPMWSRPDGPPAKKSSARQGLPPAGVRRRRSEIGSIALGIDVRDDATDRGGGQGRTAGSHLHPTAAHCKDNREERP